MSNTSEPTSVRRKFIRSTPAFRKLGISVATGWRMVKDGRLPKPISLGERLRVFDESELDALMAELAAAANAEDAA